MIDYLLICFR